MKPSIAAVSLSFCLLAGAAQASPEAPKAGTDYTQVGNSQAAAELNQQIPANKVEVIEFFWYGCPHCAAFDPMLETWVQRQGPEVVFKRVPVAFRDDFLPHSLMFHALDALGLERALTPKIFDEIQNNKNYLLTPEAQADFLAKNGVDRKKYLDAYNSFGAKSALARDKKLLQQYRIDGVPTLVVSGRKGVYTTSPAQTNSEDGSLKVVDYLTKQAQSGSL